MKHNAKSLYRLLQGFLKVRASLYNMARLEREWHDEKYDVSKFCEFYLGYSHHSPIRGIRDRRICDFKKALHGKLRFEKAHIFC